MKLSTIIAGLAWLSLITLSWLLVLRNIPFDRISVGIWLFFFILGCMSGAASMSLDKEKGTNIKPKRQ